MSINNVPHPYSICGIEAWRARIKVPEDKEKELVSLLLDFLHNRGTEIKVISDYERTCLRLGDALELHLRLEQCLTIAVSYIAIQYPKINKLVVSADIYEVMCFIQKNFLIKTNFTLEELDKLPRGVTAGDIYLQTFSSDMRSFLNECDQFHYRRLHDEYPCTFLCDKTCTAFDRLCPRYLV